MATLEIPDEVYAALTERARLNNRGVVEQALAELSGDPAEEERRKYLMNLQRIMAFPPIKSDLDPVQLIREDRDRR
jgi:hypothetical protein